MSIYLFILGARQSEAGSQQPSSSSGRQWDISESIVSAIDSFDGQAKFGGQATVSDFLQRCVTGDIILLNVTVTLILPNVTQRGLSRPNM